MGTSDEVSALTDREKFHYGLAIALVGVLFGITVLMLWLQKPEPEVSLGLAACVAIVAGGIHFAVRRRMVRAAAWGVLVLIDLAIGLRWMSWNHEREVASYEASVRQARDLKFVELCKAWTTREGKAAWDGVPRPTILVRSDWDVVTIPPGTTPLYVACKRADAITIYDLDGNRLASGPAGDDLGFVRRYAITVERPQ